MSRKPSPAPAAKRTARRPRIVTALRWLVIVAIWGGFGLALLLLFFTWDLPQPDRAMTQARRPAITLLDRSGRPFARLGDVAGQTLRLQQIPAYVPAAFIAIEDRRFDRHGPFDPFGMARALMLDLFHRRVVQGGSTITQQVAKTLFLSDRRTLRRKIQEAFLSLWLWDHYSRTDILEIYLNRVYLGAGAYGIDAAARVYFGIPASQLTLWQAAILAGLPRAPSAYNPLADPQAATKRAGEVLAAMVQTGAITKAQASQAMAAINFPPHATSGASWFGLWALSNAGSLVPQGQDVSLGTTLDRKLQDAAQAALDQAIAADGGPMNAHQGAVVVLDAQTGAVRALVGGVGDRDGYDRATLARRQTGSAFKPVVWLAALQAGLTPDSQVLDGPLDIDGYQPHDYERHYLGPVSLTTALADSLNTAAVRLLLRAGGPGRVISLARRLGLDDHLPRNATLALGAGSVGLLQLTAAYAPFFNGGLRIFPYGLTSIQGQTQLHAPPAPIITPAQAAEMTTMLRAVVARGTGTAAFIPTLFTAGKTGTSQNYRDSWFIGAARTPSQTLIIGVWVGNDDNSAMHNVTGGSLPAAIFHSIALAASTP
ncbi:MAG TPA: transglycosylase domain-containing protein [Acetobacteraceae bacterium]|nr:transglycosylase domain-containing protein [Acetobacteraceae bacterium]